MIDDLIDKISALTFTDDVDTCVKKLLILIANDWSEGLTAIKRSRIFINKFGSTQIGEQITRIIGLLRSNVPKKYTNRYVRYFSCIIPLNSLLEQISQAIIASQFWRLDKEICLTSLLARFEAVYAHLDHRVAESFNDSLKDTDTIPLGKSLFITADDGSPIVPDNKLQLLAASLDRNLRFIEYYLKRIPLVNVDRSPQIYKAGTLQLTGELWNSVCYLIDRVSFFDWYATQTDNSSTIYYEPRNKHEFMAEKLGELRESQWLLQTFLEIKETYDTFTKYIQSNDPLFPQNEDELRAYDELIATCNDHRILDVEFKNKLKVTEYIRAWFVLSEIAREHFTKKKASLREATNELDVCNLLIISKDEITKLLAEKGHLGNISAQKCIDILTYWNMDHDVFSSPIFPTFEGSYLILSSIFLSGNPARSVFRLLSYDKRDISFKGASSEKELTNIFARMGFKCLSGYNFRDGSGNGEIDCIAFKDNTFFICECKSRVPIESTYDRYRSKMMLARKAAPQANRGCHFVKSHLPQICRDLCISIPGKDDVKIYPLIITNLFDFTGQIIDGVPVCDFSALKRFTESKYVYKITRHGEKTSRIPVKELYKGDMPTVEEVLIQVRTPFQLAYQSKRLKTTTITQNMTVELILKIFDITESEISDEEFEAF
jgi:hypothetical protein